MIDAAGRNGFQNTGMREVVALAGVSNRTFYENFASMQECYLAAFDEVVGRLAGRIGSAYASGMGFPDRLRAAFDAYTEIVNDEPAETHLIMVDLISLGAEGITRRQQAAAAFELMIGQSFAEAPELGEVSEMVVRATVGGFQRVVYRRVRDEESERLKGEMGELLDWTLAYQRPGGTKSAELPGGPLTLASPPSAEAGLGEEWDQGLGEDLKGAAGRRERIIRAAAMLTGERGYASLSIPAITRAAKVSNETFYENFRSTEEAFLAAVDALGTRVLTRVEEAVKAEQGWPEAVRAGLEALLNYLAENPALARLLFVEAFGAGTPTVERVDLILEQMSKMVNLEQRQTVAGERLPAVVIEAIPGGVYLVIQREILEGRMGTLPALAPELTFFVLAPFGAV